MFKSLESKARVYIVVFHGAGKTAKQIKKIAMTSNIDFLNQYTAEML